MKRTRTDDDNSLLRNVKDSLEDIKYNVTLEDLDSIVEAGVKSPQFTSLVRFIVKEVTSLCNLQGHDDIQEVELNSEAGMMELSSFLRDLECPHTVLTEGPVTQRLEDKKARLILLDFLLSQEDKMVLDECSVASYGEVFLTNIKPKIKKRLFQDKVKQLSGFEMKRNIDATIVKTKPIKICPHNNRMNLPGIKVGKTLNLLYNFPNELFTLTANCKRCTFLHQEAAKITEIHSELELSYEAPLGSNDENRSQPFKVDGDKEEGDIGEKDNKEKNQGRRPLSIRFQHSPMDDILSVSPSSGSDWSPSTNTNTDHEEETKEQRLDSLRNSANIRAMGIGDIKSSSQKESNR